MKIEVEEGKVTIVHDLKDDDPGHIVFCGDPSCRRLADLAVDYSSAGSEPRREYYCHYCYHEKIQGG